MPFILTVKESHGFKRLAISDYDAPNISKTLSDGSEFVCIGLSRYKRSQVASFEREDAQFQPGSQMTDEKADELRRCLIQAARNCNICVREGDGTGSGFVRVFEADGRTVASHDLCHCQKGVKERFGVGHYDFGWHYQGKNQRKMEYARY